MNTLVFFLIFLSVLVVVAVVSAFVLRPRTGPSQRERELERLVDEIYEIACDNRDIGGNLSYQITDKIKETNRKELR